MTSNEKTQPLIDAAQQTAAEAAGCKLARDVITGIVQAEFCYWRQVADGAPEPVDDIAIGAIGACANILVAIHGQLSPWHPGYAEQQAARRDEADFEEAPGEQP